MSNIVYVNNNTYLILCPEAQKLAQKLLDCIRNGVDAETTYQALRAYYTHRNGQVSRGMTISEPCLKCSPWLTDK